MLAFRPDVSTRRVVVVPQSHLTLADVRKFVDWQMLEGYWEYGVLYDLRRIAHALSPEEQQEVHDYVASVTKGLPPRGPVALLIPKAIPESVAEYVKLALLAGLKVKAFSEESEATAWLSDNTSEPPLTFEAPPRTSR